MKRPAASLICGVVAALATGALLSPPIFRTGATVGVDDVAGRFRSDVVRSAADLAVSRSVLVRAATSLIETHAVVAQPGLLDRLGVLAPASPADRALTLADQLHAMVRTVPSPGAVALDVRAEAPDATFAAHAATAVANALVAFRDESVAEMRRTRDATATSRMTALRNAAQMAHHRLSVLAGTDGESAQSRAAAADQSAAAAQNRVATLRTILASGLPPLGTGKDVPQSIDALQTAYLDLTRKLAVASQTLGDRHTTIIALRDGVRRAGAALTDEWKRLLRVAEADLTSARQREASFGKADAATDGSRQAAIAEARQAARAADDAVLRADAQREATVDEPAYHLVAPAPVPLVAAAGWSLLARMLLALVAGVATMGLGRLVLSRDRAPEAPTESDPVRVDPLQMDPMPELPRQPQHDAEPLGRVASPADEAFDYFEPAVEPAVHVARGDAVPAAIADREVDPAVLEALGDIVAELVMAAPASGAVPAIMVAANEIASDTATVARTVAELAVDRGMRVLLVEGPRAKPELAAAAEPDCEPALIDLFGSLWIVLQAETSEALLVAPYFRNGASIATALSRNTQAPFLDDPAAEFDVIVVDGGRATDGYAAGLSADAYLRVGRFASRRETERFLKTLDISPDSFVGTIANTAVGSHEFVPHETDSESGRATRQADPEPSASWTTRSVGAATGSARSGFQAPGLRAGASRAQVPMRPAYPRRASVR